MQTVPGRKARSTHHGRHATRSKPTWLQRLWIFRRSRVHAASPPLPARANRSKRRKAPLSGAKPLAFLHLPQAPAAGQCPARPALRPFTPFFEIALLERGGWGARLGKDPVRGPLRKPTSLPTPLGSRWAAAVLPGGEVFHLTR